MGFDRDDEDEPVCQCNLFNHQKYNKHIHLYVELKWFGFVLFYFVPSLNAFAREEDGSKYAIVITANEKTKIVIYDRKCAVVKYGIMDYTSCMMMYASLTMA